MEYPQTKEPAGNQINAMKNQSGFTLIELVVIIVLLAIIAAVAIPRLGDVTSMKAAATAAKIKSDIRYAQELAMTRNRRTRVYFNGTGLAPGAGYAVAYDSSAANNCSSFTLAAAPAGTGNLSVTLNVGDYAGVEVTPDFNCLEYNTLGQPYNCSVGLGVCSTTSSGMSIQVKANTITVTTVTVIAQTGAVN